MNLSNEDLEWVAHMLGDALMPYGQKFDPEQAARLMQARIETLVLRHRAAAWDEGHRTTWLDDDSRECQCAAWNAGECACGNYGAHKPAPNPYLEA